MYPAGNVFIFIYCLDSLLFAAMRAPRRPVRPASRHPPQLPSARRSPLPVGREPARRRAAPRPRGAALRGKERVKSAARWQASRRSHGTTRHAAPLLRREIRNRFTRRKRKSASARSGSRHRRAARTRAPLVKRSKRRGPAPRNPDGPRRWAIPPAQLLDAPAGLQKYRRCGFHA